MNETNEMPSSLKMFCVMTGSMSSSTMVAWLLECFSNAANGRMFVVVHVTARERPESPEMTSLNFRHQDMAGFIAHHDF